MQSFKLEKTGASSLLQLSLTTNTLLDPRYYILWDALVQFRRFANLDTEASILDLAVWMSDRLKSQGLVEC